MVGLGLVSRRVWRLSGSHAFTAPPSLDRDKTHDPLERAVRLDISTVVTATQHSNPTSDDCEVRHHDGRSNQSPRASSTLVDTIGLCKMSKPPNRSRQPTLERFDRPPYGTYNRGSFLRPKRLSSLPDFLELHQASLSQFGLPFGVAIQHHGQR